VKDRVAADATESLRTSAAEVHLSPARVRELRNSQHIHYYKQIPVPRLTAEHKKHRAEFAKDMLDDGRADETIVFTDESTVQVDLSVRGVWREHGKALETLKSTFVADAHPISVMVWGGIAKTGYRTRLLRCPPSVNGVTYN